MTLALKHKMYINGMEIHVHTQLRDIFPRLHTCLYRSTIKFGKIAFYFKTDFYLENFQTLGKN